MKSGGFQVKSSGFHEIHEIWWILPWNLVDFTCEIQCISPRYHLWNSPKIIKASVLAKTLQFDECRVGAMTKDFMKSTRFHPEVWWISPMKSGRFHPDFTCEIHPNYKSKCFSKNSPVWLIQGRGYDQGFHEIHQISPWNLADLTCEIQCISPRYHLWNPPKIIKASVLAKTLQFDECRVGDFTLEIQWISPWNLVDFTHEIWQISPRFHLWNPPKIIKASVLAKTLQFDECRVGDFTLEIQWISPWNLVDFTHEIWQISPRFHLWNPPKIIKASVLAKTLQFDECRVGDFTLEIQWISPWNLVDFTHEIWQSSPRFHLWNPPKIIKASVSAKTLQFDECRVGAMTKDFTWNPPDFMKSARFQNYELLHDDQV